jgi:uncharacterized protein (TIGR02145 family)
MISFFPRYFYVQLILTCLFFSCKKDENYTPPVKDIDENTYKTIRIGTQVWMAEDLRTTRYNDETDIPLVEDSVGWNTLDSPGFCWYNNEKESYKDTYGALYNAYTVNTGKICPTGWHIPSKEEWLQLRDFLGDTISGGGKLKEFGTVSWLPPNTGADNSSGFGAMGSGIRYFQGSFKAIHTFTSFWSSTEINDDGQWYLSLYYRNASIAISHVSRKHGFSVRCLKDK